jgi:hypothetical protein
MSVTVISGNSAYNLSSGEADTNDVIVSGGSMFVLSGVVSDETMAGSGSSPPVTTVTDRGTASVGAEVDLSAGVPGGIVATLAETLEIFGGGTVVATAVDGNGDQFISAGIAQSPVFNPGHPSVAGGGTAICPATDSGTPQSVPAGVASAVTFLNSGGYEIVESGGTRLVDDRAARPLK